MKRTLLLLLCVSTVFAVFSQTALPGRAVTGEIRDTGITLRNGAHRMNIPGIMPNDSLPPGIIEQLKRKSSNGKMPNAVAVPGPADIYVGNNGRGQDIYRSQIDNMPILKPDSTFATQMPGSRTRAAKPNTSEAGRINKMPVTPGMPFIAPVRPYPKK
jgi:hypothetical protein